MSHRRRFKRQLSLQDRLSAWAKEAREHANKLRPGLGRDLLLKKARQAHTAAHMDKWMNSPGLQPPK
jgi:hypothetical protein